MGVSHSAFTAQELEEYQALTYFSKQEVIRIFERFEELDPDNVNDIECRLPNSRVADLVELRANPFRERICKVFSSSSDGFMSFEDFLNMASVFSSAAPKTLKMDYAFRVYDFDDDGIISKGDLREVVNCLIGENKLNDEQNDRLVTSIMEEADLDEDGALAYPEFEHIISKSTDFLASFGIRL